MGLRHCAQWVQNIGDFATFSVDFCTLYAECMPYSYVRVVWPTDLESIPHASTPTSIIPARFKVDMTIHCRVTAFSSTDTSRDLVTLTFDFLTLNICHAWRVTWSTMPPSMKTARLSVLELWVITLPVGYNWKCVRGHCLNLVTREYGVENNYIFVCSTTICLFTMQLRRSTLKVIKVICMREITWSVNK